MRRSLLSALIVLMVLVLPMQPARSVSVGSAASAAGPSIVAGPCPGSHSTSFIAEPEPDPAFKTIKVRIQPLLVVLEWNTYGTDALTWWPAAMQDAAAYLEDATNGQVTIGKVIITDNGCEWTKANIRVYVHNSGVPDASIGGLSASIIRSIGGRPGNPAKYPIGSIRLGRTWSQKGPLQGLWTDSDGFRTIVHELGHYVFYLYDEYYAYDDSNPSDPRPAAFCTNQRYFPSHGGVQKPPLLDNPTAASVMYWQYSVHKFWKAGDPAADANCKKTLQWQESPGLTDWQVIHAHYPRVQQPVHPSSGAGPAAGTAFCPTCGTGPLDRWLLGPFADGATAPRRAAGDGYLIKEGGQRVLHQGETYPFDPKLMSFAPSCKMPTSVVFAPGCLEMDGVGKGDIARVTGTYTSGADWQAAVQLTGSAGCAGSGCPVTLMQHRPYWYPKSDTIPLIDAMPILGGSPESVTGLQITAHDPVAASQVKYPDIAAMLYEAGLGLGDVPRSQDASLTAPTPGATLHSGLLTFPSGPPILDGSLYLTPLVAPQIRLPGPRPPKVPQQPPSRPDPPNGSAWALASYSVSCNSPTGFADGNAPSDEGGIDSADGVVNVHLIPPSGGSLTGDFCVGFTSQPAATNGVQPQTMAYGIHGSEQPQLPSGSAAVITFHYDRNFVPTGLYPEIVQRLVSSGGFRPIQSQSGDPCSATLSTRVSGSSLDGFYQVVLTPTPVNQALLSVCPPPKG